MAKKYKNSYQSLRKAPIYLGLTVLVGTLLVIVSQVQQGARLLGARAYSGQATLSILPASQTLNPSGNVQLWLNADSPVVFVQTEIDFNPAMVQLTGELSIPNASLWRVIRQTSMQDANSSGAMVLILALDPSQRSHPPTGAIQLATIKLNANVSTADATTPLVFSSTATQIVNADANLFTTTRQDSTLTLNATSATTAPIPSPTPVPNTDNQLTNSSFENTSKDWGKTWQYNIYSDSSATYNLDSSTKKDGKYSARIHVSKSSSNAHHVQLSHRFKMKKNTKYTLSFWAKSSSSRSMSVSTGQSNQSAGQGGSTSVQLTNSWKKYSYSFNGSANDSNASVSFNVGDKTGDVWVDGVTLGAKSQSSGKPSEGFWSRISGFFNKR